MDQESCLYHAQGIGKRLVSHMRQAANSVAIMLRTMLFWDITPCHTPVLNHFAVETTKTRKFTDIRLTRQAVYA
jgi:hypothetical protein